MLLTGILITLGTVWFVKWLERQTTPFVKTLLDWFPAILFAYVLPALITFIFGLDLSKIPLHQWSRDLIMPLAILTVMSALSFKQLKIVGIRPILLFLAGSAAIAVTPVVMVWISQFLFPGLYNLVIDQGYWKGLVPIVGSWIGGSTSQLVLKEVTGCPDSLFITMLVMDNILVNIWTILMFQSIKKSDVWNKRFKIKDQIPDFVPDKMPDTLDPSRSILISSVICISTLTAGYFLIPSFLIKILVFSAAGLFFGNFIRNWNHTLVLKTGSLLIVTIMAILGLRLDFQGFSLPAGILIFSMIWLVVHFGVLILLTVTMKLHFAWVPIASMANVGGISTAPAVTAAYQEEWMPFAVILAILSMVTGTSWGLLTVWLFSGF